MNLGKRILQSAIVVCLLAAVSVSLSIGLMKEDKPVSADLGAGTAGITNAIRFDLEGISIVELEISDSQEVTSPEHILEDDDLVITDDRFFQSAATQTVDPEWVNRLMVTVEEVSLNVRASASMEGEIIGKMFAGAAATVLGREGEWVHIQSGDVTGYVHSDYCVFGDEAKELAEKVGEYQAISITNGLRVRSMPTTESEIHTVIDKDSCLKVVIDAEEVEGWVAVEYNGTVAYVSAEYVKVSLVVGKAITMEEYIAQIEREQAALEEAKEDSNIQQAENLGANLDDLTLLAAIIYCEAGNQPYEGKLAVGAVVMNRVRSHLYPNDIHSVIYQGGQFAPVWDGALAKRLQNVAGIPTECIEAAKEALSGVDNVNGALYFNNVRCGRNGLVIGDHVFW